MGNVRAVEKICNIYDQLQMNSCHAVFPSIYSAWGFLVVLFRRIQTSGFDSKLSVDLSGKEELEFINISLGKYSL